MLVYIYAIAAGNADKIPSNFLIDTYLHLCCSVFV